MTDRFQKNSGNQLIHVLGTLRHLSFKALLSCKIAGRVSMHPETFLL